jgi:hypothetical protein
MRFCDVQYSVVLKENADGVISAFFDFYIKPFKQRNEHVMHLQSYKKIMCDSKGDCSICLDDMKKGQYYRKLDKCSHYFHKKCIDKWFKIDDDMTCPVCRTCYTKND